MVLLVVTNFAVLTLLTQTGNSAIAHRAGRLGLGDQNASWIDSLVGPDASVSVLWVKSGRTPWKSWYAVWENEFFNSSMGRVYVLDGKMQYALPQIPLAERRNKLYTRDGRPFVAEYVLTTRGTRVVGARIGVDEHTGAALYRVRGAVSLR